MVVPLMPVGSGVSEGSSGSHGCRCSLNQNQVAASGIASKSSPAGLCASVSRPQARAPLCRPLLPSGPACSAAHFPAHPASSLRPPRSQTPCWLRGPPQPPAFRVRATSTVPSPVRQVPSRQDAQLLAYREGEERSGSGPRGAPRPVGSWTFNRKSRAGCRWAGIDVLGETQAIRGSRDRKERRRLQNSLS